MEDVGHIHGGPIIGLLSLTKIMPHRISDSFDQLCDLDANLQCAIRLHKQLKSFNHWTASAEACGCFKRNSNVW